MLAIIAFFPTKAEGAIGGLDWTQEERRALAKKFAFSQRISPFTFT
jgi:ubiquitin-conjugating enzyme E2 J1